MGKKLQTEGGKVSQCDLFPCVGLFENYLLVRFKDPSLEAVSFSWFCTIIVI